MHNGIFTKCDELKKDTYESLKAEYDGIQKDIQIIKDMDISKEAKQPPLKELEEQINEIKERMHDYIDNL